jgi:hypothetical protein
MTAPKPQSPSPAPAPRPRPGNEPTLEIRLTAKYAWILIGAGAIFFVLGFLLGTKNPPLGIFISIASVAAVIGGNYWRHNLHVVARLTPRQLILRRDGAIDWTNIAAIDKKEITTPNHGVRHRSEFVCIKLKNKPKAREGVYGFLDKVKSTVLGGYDIVLGDSELSCTADWFIAECKKRMASPPSTTAPSRTA